MRTISRRAWLAAALVAAGCGGGSAGDSTSAASASGIAATASSAAAPDPLAGFVKHRSAGGAYEVMMPSAPKERESEVPSTLGKVVLHEASVERGDEAYVVMWNDLPASGPIETKKFLDDARDGGLRAVKATLVAEKDVELEGHYPGREVQAHITSPRQGTFFFHFFLADKRSYQVLVGGAPSDTARAFLESFKLAHN